MSLVDVDCPLFAPLRPTTRALADELHLYLEADLVDVIGKDADHAIEWWREKRSTYPQLSRMAIDYLCYRRHLHQSRGQLGVWVSRGNRPQKETLGSVSMYPLVLVTCLVDVIVCAPLSPLLPLDDVPVTSTYVCVFWTLVFPPDDVLYE